MRTTVLGIALVAVLVAVAMGAMPSAGQLPPPAVTPAQNATATNQMIVVSTVVEGRYQQVVVVDPAQKALAVYHVDLASGEVKLLSERNITWDLQMTHYNGTNPLPSEIQSLLEHR